MKGSVIIKAVIKFTVLALAMVLISEPVVSNASIFSLFKSSTPTNFSYNNFAEIDLNDLYKMKNNNLSEVSTVEYLANAGSTTKITSKVIKKETIRKATYDPNNLREKSNLTSWQISKILEGTKLEVLAEQYYDMEQKYNVNALFLMALNIEESGWGKSYLAQYKNNLGGVTSRYGGYATFESWDECLDYIANLLDKSYLSETGSYYYGTSVYDVNTKYCTVSTWATNLNTIAYQLLDKVGNIE